MKIEIDLSDNSESQTARIKLLERRIQISSMYAEKLQGDIKKTTETILSRCTPKALDGFKSGAYSSIVICSVEEWRKANKK